jgi:hypothetical protein
MEQRGSLEGLDGHCWKVSMGIVGKGFGFVLLVGAAIFVYQVLGVARETSALPPSELKALPGGGVSIDLRRLAIYDFFFTREAFVLLHVWIVWAIVRLRKSRRSAKLVDRLMVSVAIVTIGVGHAIVIWVAHQGPSVGVL